MKKSWGIGMVVFVGLLLLAPAVTAQEAETHVAIDMWGLSYHIMDNGQKKKKNVNELNPGLGIRWYYGDWFAAVDVVDRNSVRGTTWAFGGGYEYPLVEVGGFTLSPMIEVARMGYQFPKYGTLYGPVLLPGVSVRKGSIAGNVVYIPSTEKRGCVLLFFATMHLERDVHSSGELPFSFCENLHVKCQG